MTLTRMFDPVWHSGRKFGGVRLIRATALRSIGRTDVALAHFQPWLASGSDDLYDANPGFS